MIQFNSLREALSYRTTCPICNGTLTRDGMGAKLSAYRDSGVTWDLDEGEISIDTDTDKVTLKRPWAIPQSTLSPMYGIGLTNTKPGYIYLRLSMECNECQQYYNVIQIQIDLNNEKIADIELNSETLSVEEDNITYEIRNTYTTDETKYACFETTKHPLPEKDINITMPLISLDRDNPLQTIDKIRKLILFA